MPLGRSNRAPGDLCGTLQAAVMTQVPCLAFVEAECYASHVSVPIRCGYQVTTRFSQVLLSDLAGGKRLSLNLYSRE